MLSIIQKRWVMLCLFVMMCIFGYYSWKQLSIEAYPDIADVTSQVVTQVPGLAAEEVEQQILEKNTGILIIRELPDTVTANKTEAEAYSAVWDLMIELEKNLPMAFVFYGQDSLVENNKRYDEIGIFLPNSIFLKHLEKHVAKAEAIIYANK